MMIRTTILELAICTLKDRAEAAAARHAAMQAVRHYPGFVSWRALDSVEQDDLIADLVEWQDKAAADAAAQRVRADPTFAPYMAAITSVSLMQHFSTRFTM
ncbi:hypothetical protein HFC70_05305 [Agrobacterium sp. a22-2]|uniref:hypothetical protein n=1 Tax=Agrobacterium sp. a22-2 TaxID=2283840 RepID=UPI0014471D1D|nr:hypothetical protein [Agrobacterium sp. a22-2]NKN35769.1 hypothetical protein [Agrobacterium sp. a22-2]